MAAMEEGSDFHLLDESKAQKQMTESTAQAMNHAGTLPEMTVEEGQAAHRGQRLWTLLVTVVSVTCMGFAGAAMALEASTIAIAAFCVPLVAAPYVIYQRKILNKMPTLVNVINQTRHQVNRMTVQNDKFTKENDRLASEVAELKQLEFRLQHICQQNGTNVEQFTQLIKENGEIQKQMRKILDAQELQEIFSAFLKSDVDRDFQLSERELDRLMLRLRGYNMADQERLKEKLRAWAKKGDMAAWKKMDDEAEGGTLTGMKGWVL